MNKEDWANIVSDKELKELAEFVVDDKEIGKILDWLASVAFDLATIYKNYRKSPKKEALIAKKTEKLQSLWERYKQLINKR